MTVSTPQNVPALRFPEFKDVPTKSRLKDFAGVKRGAGSQYISYSSAEEGGLRLIRIGDFLGSEEVYVIPSEAIKRFLLNKGDILIAGTGATAGITFAVPDNFVNLAYSYNAPRIRLNNNSTQYFLNYLKTPNLERQKQRLFTGNAQPFLDTNDIRNFRFSVPSLPEQQKIASFLSAVDEKIERLTRKKQLLEHYKKGMMHKLFSQEFRFKDDNGNPFPDWEEKRLGDVAEFSKGKGISKNDIDEFGMLECIRYGQLYTDYAETINDVKSRTNVLAEELVLSEANDIIIPASGETQIDIATASCVLKNGVALGGDLNIIKTKHNGVFLSYYLNSVRKIDIARLSQGISVIHLYAAQLKLLQLDLPKFPEQQKIADFLSSLDDKIDLIATELSQAQTFKKGLLQQMFV